MPTPTTHTDPRRVLSRRYTLPSISATRPGAWPARRRSRRLRACGCSRPALSLDFTRNSRVRDSISDCPRTRRSCCATKRAATASGCSARCTAAGIVALVVDSSSIEVSRRARRAKTDRLDATALLRLLFRHTAGERGHWRVLHVPTVEEEDRRQVHRELARLTQERTRAINRIKGLLAVHGIRLTSLRALPDQLPHLTQWDGTPLPPGVRERLQLIWARLTLIQAQRTALVRARRALLETATRSRAPDGPAAPAAPGRR